MADIKDRAREYLTKNSEYNEVYGEFFVAVDTMTAMIEFAEQETKELKEQIEIDAKQIRALQKQNGELTDKVAELEKESKALGERCLQLQKDKGELIDKVRELEQQIEKMKCCENCAKNGHICVAEEMQGKLCGKNKDKWELRR